MSIPIPKIIVVPKGDVQFGYRDFDLDERNVNFQPVAHDILIHHLADNQRYTLMSGDGVVPEERLEDYLVRGLIDFDEINYEEHSELLYKLSGQMVRHIQSYLSSEDDVKNVLQFHQRSLVNLIRAQMLEHYEEKATAYEAHVSKGFQDIRPEAFSAPDSEPVRDFRAPVEERQNIKRMLFGGFGKCLFPVQKFDSDSERRFAAILENDANVLKWFKPQNDVFHIHYGHDNASYRPDFVVEAKDTMFICEPKMASELEDSIVLAKARAAATWCRHASEVSEKPWSYLLIAHTVIDSAKTLHGLAASCTVKA
jgi:type III restriction enzyme